MVIRFLLPLVLLITACERGASTSPPAATSTPAATAQEETAVPAPSGARSRELPDGLRPIAALIERGALPQARIAIEAHRRDNPDDPHGAFLEGLVYHRARRYAEAEPRFLEALALDPGYDLVQHFLGWCRFYLGDTAGARQAFTAHLAADPTESDSVFGLGLVELEEGRLDAADERFRAAIALIEDLERTDPARFARRRGDLGKCHARLGEVAFARGAYEDARALLERAIAEDPNQYTAYFTLSQVERRLGDVERADELQRMYDQIMEARRGRATPAEP